MPQHCVFPTCGTLSIILERRIINISDSSLTEESPLISPLSTISLEDRLSHSGGFDLHLKHGPQNMIEKWIFKKINTRIPKIVSRSNRLWLTRKISPLRGASFQLLRRSRPFGPKSDFAGRTDRRTDKRTTGLRELDFF